MDTNQRENARKTAENRSRLWAWIIAARPQTLPAGAAPVIVGTAIAIDQEMVAIGPAIAAFIGAMLIQIGTNLANDYYDAKRGVDTNERAGFTRVTHSGLIAPERVKIAMVASFSAAIVVGFYLVYIGGVPIIIIGLVSVLCGIAYAGGPFPFGSYGLGDLFVFVFFGLIATTGTYYVQAVATIGDRFPLWVPANSIASEAIIAGIVIGCLTTAILVVNNLRDIETDAAAGKYTLAVLIGHRWSKVEYVLLLAIAYAIPLLMTLQSSNWFRGLPLVSIPYAVLITRTVVFPPDTQALNDALEATGRLLVLFAILFAIGVMIS